MGLSCTVRNVGLRFCSRFVPQDLWTQLNVFYQVTPTPFTHLKLLIALYRGGSPTADQLKDWKQHLMDVADFFKMKNTFTAQVSFGSNSCPSFLFSFSSYIDKHNIKKYKKKQSTFISHQHSLGQEDWQVFNQTSVHINAMLIHKFNSWNKYWLCNIFILCWPLVFTVPCQNRKSIRIHQKTFHLINSYILATIKIALMTNFVLLELQNVWFSLFPLYVFYLKSTEYQISHHSLGVIIIAQCQLANSKKKKRRRRKKATVWYKNVKKKVIL